jgi:hypothetical protein
MSGVVDCAAYAQGRRVADVAIEDISEVLRPQESIARAVIPTTHSGPA